MFFVGQPLRVASGKAEALPYVNLFFAFTIYYGCHKNLYRKCIIKQSILSTSI